MSNITKEYKKVNSKKSIEELRKETPYLKCNTCFRYLKSEKFSRDNYSKSGLSYNCKDCARFRKNEQVLKRKAKWENKNPRVLKPYKKCSDCERDKKSSDFSINRTNPDGLMDICYDCAQIRLKEWRKNNTSKLNKYSAKRRAKLKQATPNWLSENDYKQIALLYDLAQFYSMVTGIEHHVDHIIPLKGDTVCGLHVPWNLQILTKELNLIKGNKLLDVYKNV